MAWEYPECRSSDFSLVPQKHATLSIPAALDACMSITLSAKEMASFADMPISSRALSIDAGCGLIGFAS